MIGRLKDLTINRDQSQNITLTVNVDFRETFDKLKDNNINIEIKKASSRRSMDANAYFWHLCGEIAKVSSRFSNDGKEDVYREAIRAKGEWMEVPVSEADIPILRSKWSQNGSGWFVDVIDDYVPEIEEYTDLMGDKVDSIKTVHIYFGSSTYDSLSMSRIIDYVVNIANDLGIPTMTEKELNKTLESWQKKVDKREQVHSST